MRLLRLLPLLVFLVAALLAWLLGFNGLYGQDAHEYLRQSEVLYQRLHGLPAPPPGPGDAILGSGFPLAGALLRLLISNRVLALQLVTWLSAGGAVAAFLACLGHLTPGVHLRSRVLLVVLLASAPVFVQSALTSMSDLPALAFSLTALYNGKRVLERRRATDAALLVLWAGLAVLTRWAAAVLLLPLVLVVGFELVRRQRWGALLAMAASAALPLALYYWLEGGWTWPQHHYLHEWSAWHLLQRSFQTADGTSNYLLPNALYVLFPLGHPAFCLLVLPLFLLGRRTDLLFPAQRMLLACLVLYLLFLGGLPVQALRFLLPAWALLLLLLAPAWDRFVSYGLYFLPALARWLLVAAFALQVVWGVKTLRPPVVRQRLEKVLAQKIAENVPPGAAIYAFDVDVALQNYHPEYQWKNLWTTRYDSFPAGSYLLFNEPALRQQWAGHNPMLNWDHARQQYNLDSLTGYEGWTLYRLR